MNHYVSTRKLSDARNQDPNFGFIVGGKRLKPKPFEDNEEGSQEFHYVLPATVNQFSMRTGTFVVNKAEKFPNTLYDEQRKDVAKFLAKHTVETPDVVGLRPQADGFVGIFVVQGQPYLFSMKSDTGFLYKPADDQSKAEQMLSYLLGREQALAVGQMRVESAAALDVFADKLSKAIQRKENYGHIAYKRYDRRTGKVIFVRAKGVRITIPAKTEIEGDELNTAVVEHLHSNAKHIEHEADLDEHLSKVLKDHLQYKKKRPSKLDADHGEHIHIIRDWLKTSGFIKHHDDYTAESSFSTEMALRKQARHERNGTEPPQGKLRKGALKPWHTLEFVGDPSNLLVQRQYKGTPLFINGKPFKPQAHMVNGRMTSVAEIEAACMAASKAIKNKGAACWKRSTYRKNFADSMSDLTGKNINWHDKKVFKAFYERAAAEREHAKLTRKKAKGPVTSKTHPDRFCKVNGVISDFGAAKLPGGQFFNAKSDKKLDGRWVPFLSVADCTTNGSKPPKGWKGKSEKDHTKQALLTYLHPLTAESGYLYPSVVRNTNKMNKYADLKEFKNELPAIREQVEIDLNNPNKKIRACALLTWLMDKAQFRIGGAEGAKRGTRGVSTFLREHVEWEGKNKISCDFPGKDNEEWIRDIEMPANVAKVFHEFTDGKAPKDSIFPDVSGSDTNTYLQTFSDTLHNHQFRTYHANRYAHKYLDVMESTRKAMHLGTDELEAMWKGINPKNKRHADFHFLVQTADRISKATAEACTPGLTVPEVYKHGKGTLHGAIPFVANILGHTVGSCREHYLDPRGILKQCAAMGFDARTRLEKKDATLRVEVGRIKRIESTRMKKSLKPSDFAPLEAMLSRDDPTEYNTGYLDQEEEYNHFLDFPGADLYPMMQRPQEVAKKMLDVKHYMVVKGFPVNKPAAGAKQAPKPTAAGAKAGGKGATGKARYDYSAQGKEKGQPAKPEMRGQHTEPQPPTAEEVTPAEVEPETFVDPKRIATAMNTQVATLRKLAKRFQSDTKLGGKKGFVRFFLTRFKEFSEKHRLGRAYIVKLWDSLVRVTNTDRSKP